MKILQKNVKLSQEVTIISKIWCVFFQISRTFIEKDKRMYKGKQKTKPNKRPKTATRRDSNQTKSNQDYNYNKA